MEEDRKMEGVREVKMKLEQAIDAAKIVREAGMSSNPGHYSGRGARVDDLDHQKLEIIYQRINAINGEAAAAHFVQMISEIPKLSATDFLLALYRLEVSKWRWHKRLLGSEGGIYAENVGAAFGTVAAVLSGMSERDETPSIRDPFLKRHGVDLARIVRSLPLENL